jgi:hypothetical protein
MDRAGRIGAGASRGTEMVTLARRKRRRILVGVNYGTKQYATTVEVPARDGVIRETEVVDFGDGRRREERQVEFVTTDVTVTFGAPPQFWYDKFAGDWQGVPHAVIVRSKRQSRVIDDTRSEPYESTSDRVVIAADVEDFAAMLSVRLGPAIAEIEAEIEAIRTKLEEIRSEAEAMGRLDHKPVQIVLNHRRRWIRKLESQLRLQRQMQSSIDRYLDLMQNGERIPEGPVAVAADGDG